MYGPPSYLKMGTCSAMIFCDFLLIVIVKFENSTAPTQVAGTSLFTGAY